VRKQNFLKPGKPRTPFWCLFHSVSEQVIEKPVSAKTVLNVAWWTVFGLIFAAILSVQVVPHLWGGVGLTILSGSMEPAIHPGDIVVTKPVSRVEDVALGDVVVYATEDSLITHRVIGFGIGNGESTVILQGDANGAQDEPVVSGQLRGKVIYTVPKVGYASAFVKQHFAVVLGSVGTLILASTFYGLVKEGRKAKNGACTKV